ncbi:hypothetical protein NEPAR06_2400 [Nematocida parisii]|nr:hypothetical protein NEPAR06_2400 [Nematocida parisii]
MKIIQIIRTLPFIGVCVGTSIYQQTERYKQSIGKEMGNSNDRGIYYEDIDMHNNGYLSQIDNSTKAYINKLLSYEIGLFDPIEDATEISSYMNSASDSESESDAKTMCVCQGGSRYVTENTVVDIPSRLNVNNTWIRREADGENINYSKSKIKDRAVVLDSASSTAESKEEAYLNNHKKNSRKSLIINYLKDLSSRKPAEGPHKEKSLRKNFKTLENISKDEHYLSEKSSKQSKSTENISKKEDSPTENISKKEDSPIENISKKEGSSTENVSKKEDSSTENISHVRHSKSTENVNKRENSLTENISHVRHSKSTENVSKKEDKPAECEKDLVFNIKSFIRYGGINQSEVFDALSEDIDFWNLSEDGHKTLANTKINNIFCPVLNRVKSTGFSDVHPCPSTEPIPTDLSALRGDFFKKDILNNKSVFSQLNAIEYMYDDLVSDIKTILNIFKMKDLSDIIIDKVFSEQSPLSMQLDIKLLENLSQEVVDNSSLYDVYYKYTKTKIGRFDSPEILERRDKIIHDYYCLKYIMTNCVEGVTSTSRLSTISLRLQYHRHLWICLYNYFDLIEDILQYRVCNKASDAPKLLSKIVKYCISYAGIISLEKTPSTFAQFENLLNLTFYVIRSNNPTLCDIYTKEIERVLNNLNLDRCVLKDKEDKDHLLSEKIIITSIQNESSETNKSVLSNENVFFRYPFPYPAHAGENHPLFGLIGIPYTVHVQSASIIESVVSTSINVFIMEFITLNCKVWLPDLCHGIVSKVSPYRNMIVGLNKLSGECLLMKINLLTKYSSIIGRSISLAEMKELVNKNSSKTMDLPQEVSPHLYDKYKMFLLWYNPKEHKALHKCFKKAIKKMSVHACNITLISFSIGFGLNNIQKLIHNHNKSRESLENFEMDVISLAESVSSELSEANPSIKNDSSDKFNKILFSRGPLHKPITIDHNSSEGSTESGDLYGIGGDSVWKRFLGENYLSEWPKSPTPTPEDKGVDTVDTAGVSKEDSNNPQGTSGDGSSCILNPGNTTEIKEDSPSKGFSPASTKKSLNPPTPPSEEDHSKLIMERNKHFQDAIHTIITDNYFTSFSLHMIICNVCCKESGEVNKECEFKEIKEIIKETVTLSHTQLHQFQKSMYDTNPSVNVLSSSNSWNYFDKFKSYTKCIKPIILSKKNQLTRYTYRRTMNN